MTELQEFHDGLFWTSKQDQGLLIGVTQSAIDLAGAILEIEASDVDDEFEAGDWIGELRGKNSLVEIVAPCALRIVERNEEILGQPSLLEDDPTGDGWVFRIERI